MTAAVPVGAVVCLRSLSAGAAELFACTQLGAAGASAKILALDGARFLILVLEQAAPGDGDAGISSDKDRASIDVSTVRCQGAACQGTACALAKTLTCYRVPRASCSSSAWRSGPATRMRYSSSSQASRRHSSSEWAQQRCNGSRGFCSNTLRGALPSMSTRTEWRHRHQHRCARSTSIAPSRASSAVVFNAQARAREEGEGD
jgi:hypothetical protein